LEESTSAAAALEPSVAGEATAATSSEPTRKPSTFERIYAENRQKAAAAHARLKHLDPPGGYPPVVSFLRMKQLSFLLNDHQF